MGNRLILIVIIILAIFNNTLFAAEFNASVENSNIGSGQSIQLKLEIVDAKAKEPLDLGALTKDFTVYHQQKYSSYSNTNGVVQSEQGWYVTLLPKRNGELTIPAISITTNQGNLSTQPFTIHVGDSKSGNKSEKDNLGISIVATVNKTKAYVNEPIIYTLKIISHVPIVNVVLEDIKSDDVFIEKIGDPKQYDKNNGGVLAHIIELRYAITGINPGKITIAPAVMSGEVQIAKNVRSGRYSVFSHPFFDNSFELKPFRMQSEEIKVEMLPAQATTSEWLPLSNLTVTQTINPTKEVKVGETITRKIKMVANGGFAQSLPTTTELQQIDKVKVYANKPQYNDTFNETTGNVVGTKEEEFSFVPQTEGELVLPEVQVNWWNLKTKKLETSILPAKTYNIVANNSDATPNVTLDFSDNEPQQIKDQITDNDNEHTSTFYVILGLLAGILGCMVLILSFWFVRRIKVKATSATPKSKPLDIPNVKNIPQLRAYILEYAQIKWGIDNCNLSELGVSLTGKNYIYDFELYRQLLNNINAALYADVQTDIKVLIDNWEQFRDSIAKTKSAQIKSNKHKVDLNPT